MEIFNVFRFCLVMNWNYMTFPKHNLKLEYFRLNFFLKKKEVVRTMIPIKLEFFFLQEGNRIYLYDIFLF